MSNKPGGKSVKRASSSCKKKSGTPDSGTPTASGATIGADKLGHESSIDDVLLGDDVQALRITEEDLIKVHPPKLLTTSPHKRKVVVRRSQLPMGAGTSHRKEREVAVLHPLPSGTTFTTSKTIGTMEGGGPRLDQKGMFLSHSVLGPAREYVTEVDSQPMVGSTNPWVVLPDTKQQPHPKSMSCEKTILPREKHSLRFWDESMQQRKALQRQLCSKCDTLPNQLVMNQGDKYRGVQEERMAIDRAMPSVGYGKGHRVGSEFWSHPVHVGTEDTGIHTTLTRTEQGLPPELEFVGIPNIVAKERGLAKDSKQTARFHHTWEQSPYLLTQKQQLAGALADVHRPEVSELALIGKAPGHKDEITRADSLDSLGDSVCSTSEEELGSMLDMYEDISSQPIIGPALLVNGQLLMWEGVPQHSVNDISAQCNPAVTQSESALNRAQSQESTISLRHIDRRKVNFLTTPIEFRLNFESDTGIKAVSNIELENCGTAAVYYSWQSFPKPNPLGTIQAGDVQRFYFDTRGGVLLPKQKLTFPFTFKSRKPGAFSEMWLLKTGPVLCRGRQIVFILKGFAFQEDKNKAKREDLERELKHRMAVDAAERLVNRLVDSIKTPPHSLQPIQTIEMEEHIFKSQNPELYYHHGVVLQLKHLYDAILRPDHLLAEQLANDPSQRTEKSGTGKKDDKSGGMKSKDKPSAKDKKGSKPKDDSIKEEVLATSQEEEARPQIPDWDLSISSLREVVLGIDDVAVVEGKLKELSTLVGLLSFPLAKPVRQNSYNTVYEALCEVADQICSVSNGLCRVMGLPLREFSQRDESGSGDKLGEPDGVVPSQPSSPAQTKDKKKKDSKKPKPGKDSVRAASSKNKNVTPKKSKPTLGIKESDTIKQGTSEIATEIDPVMEKKYSDNLYSSVYEILGTAMGRIDKLLSPD